MAVPPRYGLKFDGVNDYVNNSSYTEWERTQAWTFTCLMIGSSDGAVFSNITTDANQRGIVIRFRNATGDIQVRLNNNTGANRIVVNWTASGLSDKLPIMYHITYDGSSNANNLLAYRRANLLTPSIVTNGLSATIVNSLGRYFIGAETALNVFNSGLIGEFTFVNYVKNSTQITDDWEARRCLETDSSKILLKQNFNLRQGLSVGVTGTKAINSTASITGQTVGLFKPLLNT